MKKAIYLTVMFAMATLVGFSVEANAQYRVNQGNAKKVIKRIENGADEFKKSLDNSLDRSRINERRGEDRINEYVSDFENATDRLRRDWENANLAQDVLRRGRIIDQFMRQTKQSSKAEREWSNLKRDLDQLARLYGVSWNWNDDNDYKSNGRNDRGNNDRSDRRDSGRYDNNRNGINYGSADSLIRNIETKADSFKRILDRDLDQSRVDGRRAEDRINDFVKEFENATDRLRSDYKDDRRRSGAVQEVLTRGKTIDNYMRRLRGSSNSKRAWNSLRADLDQLARLYRVSWKWGR